MMFLVSSSMGLQIGQSTGPTRRAVLGGAGAAFASNFAFPALPAFAADVDTAAIMKAKAGLQAASHAASCNSQPAAHTRRPPHTPFGRRSPRTPTAPPQALIDKDPDFGPTMVRLAWHSSGTYDKIAKNGGSQGGTIRFKEELAHGGNAGLDKAVARLEPLKAELGDAVSYADLFTLAGVVAISQNGGPQIPWKAGRKDQDVAAVTPNGRLPDADKNKGMKTNSDHLRSIFYRMGFDDKEIVALSGAHALGRCHPDASGYDGPWSPTPTTLNNVYFSSLIYLPWTIRDWKGPEQYEDPSGKLMMLPSDIALIHDKSFLKYVKMYAKQPDAFRADFTAAFQKLEENGTKNLKPVDIWA